jgi:hypothetical protein
LLKLRRVYFAVYIGSVLLLVVPMNSPRCGFGLRVLWSSCY